MVEFFINNKQDNEYYVRVFPSFKEGLAFVKSLNRRKTWAFATEKLN